MISDKYIELIHREIDGLNSPRESARLRDYLAANPQAQQFYVEMAATSSLLQEVRAVEPPAHLPHEIMSRLPANRYGASLPTGWWAGLRERLEVKFNFNYVYAFAGGLAVGVALFVLASQTTMPPLDADKLSGTMLRRDRQSEFETIKSLEIDRDGVTGKIEVQQSAEAVRAELALVSTQPIALALSFDEQRLGFTSLAVLEGPALGEAILISGAAQWTHVGQKRYALVLTKKERASSKLEVKIVRAGSLLGEWAIPVE
jgi:anti-sigma factor RsiW